MGGKPELALAQGFVKVEGRAGALSELLSRTTAPEFRFPIITRPS